jgi:hypothetical protein
LETQLNWVEENKSTATSSKSFAVDVPLAQIFPVSCMLSWSYFLPANQKSPAWSILLTWIDANASRTHIVPVAPMQSLQPELSYGSFESPSQSSFSVTVEQNQVPRVIISEPSPPNPRPRLIMRIRQATARREKAKEEEEAAKYVNIEG